MNKKPRNCLVFKLTASGNLYSKGNGEWTDQMGRAKAYTETGALSLKRTLKLNGVEAHIYTLPLRNQ